MEETKAKCIFSCDIKKISFYPFLLPVIYMTFRFYKDRIIDSSYPRNVKNMKYNLPFLFYLYLPKILAIILIPIIKYKTEGDSHEENRISKNYHVLSIQKNKRKMFLLICLISLLEVIQDNGDLLLYYYQWLGPIKWLVEKKTGLILFVPFLCYFILKIDLFSHHILALVLGLIGAFIANFCRFPLGFSTLKDFPFHLLNIFFSFLLSLALVLIKYVMINFVMMSPYLFLFYNGIFNIVNSFIYILLEYVIVVHLPSPSNTEADYKGNYFEENYLGIFKLLKGQESEFYVYFAIIFILLFFYYIITALTIYNFNPYLIIIVETCLPIDTDMIERFYKKNINNEENIIPRALSQLVGYIIIIFSALILNEIIVLNFLDFNKNIRESISSRSLTDVEGLFTPGRDPNETEMDETFNESSIEK